MPLRKHRASNTIPELFQQEIKAVRLLILADFLRQGGTIRSAAIADAFGISQRSAQRDIAAIERVLPFIEVAARTYALMPHSHGARW